MRLDRSELSKAVQTALSLGAVAAVGVAGSAFAQNATPTQDNNQQQPQTLQTIVVTGSHIRRVDLETSNPVVAITAQQVQATGKLTLGDLVQDLPQITGSPQNPRVNNGGGSGFSGASLRGLGSGRTLVLVNGHRVANQDLNIVPVELVDRVEVLTDGGAVTYGSDAIGGVVNFILKKNYQGAEFSTNYGISDRDDGERKGASFIFGQTTDKGSILAGVDYNKQDGVLSGDRDFSKYATYLYYGYRTNLGSARTPFGSITLPGAPGSALRSTFNCTGPGSNNRVTLASGNGAGLGDYRCYTPQDAYNYQTVNLNVTPQERVNGFFEGDYQLTDNVQAYMDVFYNTTTSNSALAALPFDANSDGVTISRYSMYNPFGVDFGPPNPGNPETCVTDPDSGSTSCSNQYQMQSRWTGQGQRQGHVNTKTAQGIVGLRGNIADTGWQWDANYNYGHISTAVHTVGDFFYNAAFKNAVGPSMLDPTTGQPICVTTPNDATTAIPGCTPLNIFNVLDPTQIDLQKAYVATIFSNTLNTFRAYTASVNGPIAHLPAGDMQLAVGATYRKLYQNTIVDFPAILDPTTGSCSVPQSACSSPLRGGYNVKEAYAELYIPILTDMPFFRHLSVDLGDRYSKYSLAGSTNNWKVGVEWKPIDDLLLRGTVQKVFRAPTIGALFTGPTGNAPQFVDPCIGLSAADLAAHSAACQNVPPGYGGSGNAQTTGIVSGSVYAGVNLAPESGKTFDWGAVYSPHYIPGLTITADLWRVYLNDLISTPGAQTIANVCFGDNGNAFCNLIHRLGNGDVDFINQPTLNYGRLDTSGVDASLSYNIPQVGWLPGRFNVMANYTYLKNYDVNVAPGTGIAPVHLAGKYNKDYGNYSRNRFALGLSWQDGPWNASWRSRWIGSVTVGSDDPGQAQSADYALPLVTLRVPNMVYNDFQVGYEIEPINTRIDVGVDNAFDKQPPMMFQNNVLNADTDVNTFDTIGRFYWGRITVKF